MTSLEDLKEDYKKLLSLQKSIRNEDGETLEDMILKCQEELLTDSTIDEGKDEGRDEEKENISLNVKKKKLMI